MWAKSNVRKIRSLRTHLKTQSLRWSPNHKLVLSKSDRISSSKVILNCSPQREGIAVKERIKLLFNEIQQLPEIAVPERQQPTSMIPREIWEQIQYLTLIDDPGYLPEGINIASYL